MSKLLCVLSKHRDSYSYYAFFFNMGYDRAFPIARQC
mgnify:CR=1 FL=1